MSLNLILFLFFVSMISNISLFFLLFQVKLKNNELKINQQKLQNQLDEKSALVDSKIQLIKSINNWVINQPAIIRQSLLNSVRNKKYNADNVINISDYIFKK